VKTPKTNRRTAMPTSAPLAELRAEEMKNAAHEHFRGCRTRTVLIVEDDGPMRQSLAAALSSEFRVLTAGSGTEAIRTLRESRPDAVLLDIVMPDGDGFSVLGAVEGLRPRPRVVVLSALNQVTKAVKAMRLGASDYLVKPCGLDRVRSVLNGVLEGDCHSQECRGAP
jgi:DNA-binding NtrC family response regulator